MGTNGGLPKEILGEFLERVLAVISEEIFRGIAEGIVRGTLVSISFGAFWEILECLPGGSSVIVHVGIA